MYYWDYKGRYYFWWCHKNADVSKNIFRYIESIHDGVYNYKVSKALAFLSRFGFLRDLAASLSHPNMSSKKPMQNRSIKTDKFDQSEKIVCEKKLHFNFQNK